MSHFNCKTHCGTISATDPSVDSPKKLGRASSVKTNSVEQTRSYRIAQGTLLNVMWQPG